jgi:NAD(P)H-flavin reductase
MVMEAGFPSAMEPQLTPVYNPLPAKERLETSLKEALKELARTKADLEARDAECKMLREDAASKAKAVTGKRSVRKSQCDDDEGETASTTSSDQHHDEYKLTQSEDGTVTRDGFVTPGAVGPLVWLMTVNGALKLQRNAMCEHSFKYHALSSHPGAQIQTWLEKQERDADGASKDVRVSNVVTYVYKEPVALDAKKWVSFPLESRIDINHNTRRLRFKLPVRNLGLPVGMHIFLKGKIDGSPVMRAYTPVGSGPFYVEFIIKVYFPLPPKFPDGGKLTQHMETLKVGETLDFKGPLGHFDFDCSGVTLPRDTLSTFKNEGSLGGSFKHLGLIAGGSGITPCLQVAEALLKLDRDFTISLLYANQSPEDILCQEELDSIVKDPRVKVWYTVDRAPDGWKYSTGFISEDMLREHLPAASEHTYVFMCGPPPMLKFACRPSLDKLGHAEERVLAF